jgi:hypothetical protein
LVSDVVSAFCGARSPALNERPSMFQLFPPRRLGWGPQKSAVLVAFSSTVWMASWSTTRAGLARLSASTLAGRAPSRRAIPDTQ